eukprot:GFUD01007944.1.p1 GENE.GFUD01007944.1~~GFUD01007944.1.p1  ORF type:complete len:204 (+),score=50.50 GFUD01007944.1:75-686(+)
MNFAAVFLSVAVVISQGAFCPGERRNGKRCLAKERTYKCGSFFEYLVPDKPITWLGALPDSIENIEEDEYKEILGENITLDSFKQFSCDPVAANARCYGMLAKFKNTTLDSCEKSLVKTRSALTIGDHLCGQVRRWLRRDRDFQANGKDNIRISFYYSQCGEDWTPITDGVGGALYTDEELCCSPNGRFRRCDGSDYQTECYH